MTRNRKRFCRSTPKAPRRSWRQLIGTKSMPAAGRLLRKLIEAERGAASKGRHGALQAARDRFYKGDIAHAMAAFAESQGALFRYEDFATYTVKVETPVSSNYRGFDVYKNPSAS